jgi:hypothetical protein
VTADGELGPGQTGSGVPVFPDPSHGAGSPVAWAAGTGTSVRTWPARKGRNSTWPVAKAPGQCQVCQVPPLEGGTRATMLIRANKTRRAAVRDFRLRY